MAKNETQKTLFDESDIPADWKEHWKEMPEFVMEDLKPFRTLYVHFECADDVKSFAKLMGQTITPDTKYLWFPKPEEKLCSVEKEYVDES